MAKWVHNRVVAPVNFANWIKKHTSMWVGRRFPTERGQFCLQQAESIPWDNPRTVIIKGVYSVTVPGENAERIIGNEDADYIRFELLPLDSERTEITTTCIDDPTVLALCAALLEGIEQTWHAENVQTAQPEQTTMQAPAPTDTPKTPKWSRDQIAFALLVGGFFVALFACIGTWLVVPEVREVIQTFVRGAIPTLTPTLSPTATP